MVYLSNNLEANSEKFIKVFEKMQLILLVISILSICVLGFLLNQEHKKNVEQDAAIKKITSALKAMANDTDSLESDVEELQSQVSDIEFEILYWR